MKKISLLLILSFLIISCTKNVTTESDVENAMNEKYPHIKIDSVERLNDSFFEIAIQDQIFYLTTDFRHLIAGNIIDFQSGINLTENSIKVKRKSFLSKIKNEDTVIYKPKKVNHTITIFTDTSCPYCQKMHNEINDLLENNIAIRYVLFSRNGVDDDAYEDMVSVWCADDRKTALDQVFKNNFIRDMECNNPIKDNYNLASDLNVNGTPMIFIEDGTVIPGYVSSRKIIEILAQLNKSK